MDEWVVGRAVVGMGLGVCVCGKAARRTFPAIVQVLLATSGEQPPRPAGGKVARWTFPWIFQVFFEIPGDVRRAALQAGRGEGCAPDVLKDCSGVLRNPWGRPARSPPGRPRGGVRAGRPR